MVIEHRRVKVALSRTKYVIFSLLISFRIYSIRSFYRTANAPWDMAKYDYLNVQIYKHFQWGHFYSRYLQCSRKLKSMTTFFFSRLNAFHSKCVHFSCISFSHFICGCWLNMCIRQMKNIDACTLCMSTTSALKCVTLCIHRVRSVLYHSSSWTKQVGSFMRTKIFFWQNKFYATIYSHEKYLSR